MSTFAELRDSVLGLMQVNLEVVDPLPGTALSESTKSQLIDNLLLRAANSARKRAEKLNPNWVFNEVSSEVTVTAGGTVSLKGHVDIDTEEEFDYKILTEVTHEGCPINLNTKNFHLRRLRLRKRACKIYGVTRNDNFSIAPALDESVDLIFYGVKWMQDYGGRVRDGLHITNAYLEIEDYFVYTKGKANDDKPIYSTDGEASPSINGIYPYAVFSWTNEDGGKWQFTWYIDSGTTVNWTSDEAVATPDLVTEWTPSASPDQLELIVTSFDAWVTSAGFADTDWMLEHGSDYLQWATIVELNHLLKTFVARQEGNLEPPIRLRDEALEALIRWDTDMRDIQMNGKSR